jgi:hypothetical protein
MPALIKQLWIGLDWGTHSSKWWYSVETVAGEYEQAHRSGAVIDSTVHRTGDGLAMVRERTPLRSEIQDPRLKRLLLNDPQGASYWEAMREGIRISLGEAAALTLALLLGEAIEGIRTNFRTDTNLRLHLCFSLPNWINSDPRHEAARRRMFETTIVLAGLVQDQGLQSLPGIGQNIGISDWRERLREVRQSEQIAVLLRSSAPDFATLVEKDFRVGNISWRLAAESSAAGFPPLLRLLMPEAEAQKTQDHWVKLLVVDVGAGSTDCGYFVSSRRHDGSLILNYLRPAPTLDYAGEQLTEMLRDYYLREKGRDLTIQEAETLKLDAPDQWVQAAFVGDWRSRIAKAVGDYMYRVPDQLRLGEPAIPGLKIVMTGGSGMVRGLDTAIRDEVVEALGRRGVPGNVAARTEVVPFTPERTQYTVDQLRRAVSIGAGQSNFADLRYREAFARAAAPPGQIERW